MNTVNNARRKASRRNFEKAFVNLLQEKSIKEITVAELCKETGLNRSTFYANYLDVFDLADQVRKQIEEEFSAQFAQYDYFNERTGALQMFTHIKENQLFYKTYFKLCYDPKHLIYTYDPKRAELELGSKNIRYHIEFFRHGLNAIIKMWLESGCRETPEEMAEILKTEYKGR